MTHKKFLLRFVFSLLTYINVLVNYTRVVYELKYPESKGRYFISPTLFSHKKSQITGFYV